MSFREIREEGADIVRKLAMWELAYGKPDAMQNEIEGGDDIA